MTNQKINAGEYSATIQILVHEAGDEAALAELLEDRFEVTIAPTLQSADCFLLDDRTLPRFREELIERKRDSHPVFMPVL